MNRREFFVPTMSGALASAYGASLLSAASTPALAQDDQAPLGGHPSAGLTQSVPNLDAQVAYQCAFNAVLWAVPASQMYRFRLGVLEVPGMADNVILAYSKPLRPIQEAVTPNQVTPYIVAVTDLRKGPVVLELPAKTDKGVLYGQIVDAWQAALADVGPSGADKGAGGKYLLVPPDYKDPVPDGYFGVKSTTYRVLFVFRSIQLGGATQADAYAYSKTLKLYPLSEAANPKPTQFVDGTPYPAHTLPFYDIRGLKDIYDIVSVEPVQARDKVMMGMLATIGIERGKPFNPPERYKAAMEKGIVDAYYYMQDLDTKLFASNLYWPDRHWSFVMVPDAQKKFEFVSDDSVDFVKRAACYFFFIIYPRTLTDNAATVYLAPIADNAGRPLAAGKSYKLHVPNDIPAGQFWSLTVYDRATWALIRNPLERGTLGQFDKDKMKVNADGSVDLYFGPRAPAGLESNWIPTMGKTPFLFLRLYSPQEAFWSKSFKMPDVDLVT